MIDFDTPAKRPHPLRDAGWKSLMVDDDPPLADTIPPIEPPPAVALALPKAHQVVAWYHDGRVTKTSHATLEAARDYADALHWALVYKFMILCGRAMVERKSVEVPS